MSARLRVPSNITLLVLPPKCPELYPDENLWQFMHDNWLSNRIFKSYEDILGYCCFALNKLIAQPYRIMSIGLRDWVHASRLMRIGIREKLIKIGATIISHGRYVAFQMAEVAIPRHLFADMLRLIAELRPPPDPSPA